MDPKRFKWGNHILKVDIGPATSAAIKSGKLSRNQINKMVRLGKPFPDMVVSDINDLVIKKVKEYRETQK
ncbi:MAG: hypothetical protein ABSF21_00135 [Dehalococcoidia bacterium]|jgi:hypothetical protein